MVKARGPRTIWQGIFHQVTASHSKISAAYVHNQKKSDRVKPDETKHRRRFSELQALEVDEEGNRKDWGPEEVGRKIGEEQCTYKCTSELEIEQGMKEEKERCRRKEKRKKKRDQVKEKERRTRSSERRRRTSREKVREGKRIRKEISNRWRWI